MVNEDRLTIVDNLVTKLMDSLPCIYDTFVSDEYKMSHFVTDPDRTEILSSDEDEIDMLADALDDLYGEQTVTTGYYDPEEDKRNNEVDAYTGLYYLSIA